MIDNKYKKIKEGSIWEQSERHIIWGEVHLDGVDNDFWIEVTKERLKDCFVEVDQ